jgi:hypothetical protein
MMDKGIEKTVMQYYPERLLASPLDNERIRWDYDPNHALLKKVVAALSRIDPTLRAGSRGDYVISEEVVLLDGIKLQLSYLGPYAALNYGAKQPLSHKDAVVVEKVRTVLNEHNITLLSENDLNEASTWIRGTHDEKAITVWNCLFANEPM